MERVTTVTFRTANYLLDFVGLSFAFCCGVVGWWFWYFRSVDPALLNQIDKSKLVVPYLIFYLTMFSYLAISGAYAQSRLRSLHESLLVYLRAVSVAVVVLAVVSFFVPFIYISRTLIVVTCSLSLAFLATKEIMLRRLVAALRKRGLHVQKALILGRDERLTRMLLFESESQYLLGIDIVGIVDPIPGGSDSASFDDSLVPILGSVAELVPILKEHCPGTLIVYAKDMANELLEEVITVCEERGIAVWIKLDMLERVVYSATLHSVRGVPFISFFSTPQNYFALFIKYSLDRIAAFVLLLLLSPLFLLIAIAIRIDSRGPILFSQRRAGMNASEFYMLKFRSMVVNAEELKHELQMQNEMQGPHFKMKDDPRITRVGRFLRRSSLDELPQLWNVLRGEMSLVGPRPMDYREVDNIEGWHRRRLSMKPGLTCIWQVAGRNQISEFDDWARMDLEYIDNWSLMLDIVLLLKTIPVVLLGRGAS